MSIRKKWLVLSIAVLGFACLAAGCGPGDVEEEEVDFDFEPDVIDPTDEVDGVSKVIIDIPLSAPSVQETFTGCFATPATWQVFNPECLTGPDPSSLVAVPVTTGCSASRLNRLKNELIAQGCPSTYQYLCFETVPTTFQGGMMCLLRVEVTGPVDATGKVQIYAAGAAATDLDDLLTPLETYASGRSEIKVRAPSTQRWLFTELALNATRFVEVTNISTAPQSVDGLGFLISDVSSCPSVTPAGAGPQVNGAYVSSRTDLVPAGNTYVFMEGGTAGDPNLPGCAGLGERTGFNFSVSPTSGLEAALYENATLLGADEIGGDGVDYVRVLPDAGVPIVDGFRHRPTGPGGAWLDEGIGIAGAPTLIRILVLNEYRDSDTSSDWLSSGAPGCGQPTPIFGTTFVPPANGPAVDLDFESQPGGFLSLSVRTKPAMIRSPLFNLISLQPTACAGSGPAIGLALDVVPQALLPAGTEPFVVETDFAGEYGFQVGVAPPGLSLEARSVVFKRGTTPVLSNFVYLITQ